MKCVEHLFGEFNWFAHVTGDRTTLFDLKGIVATCAAMVQEGHDTRPCLQERLFFDSDSSFFREESTADSSLHMESMSASVQEA